MLEYLRRTTGLSRSQVTKLVGRSQREAQLRDRRRPGRPFASKYTRADIAALAELDGERGRLSGPATRKLCQRAWEVYGDVRYERLAGISNGHVYNLRKTVAYRRRLASVEPTPHLWELNMTQAREASHHAGVGRAARRLGKPYPDQYASQGSPKTGWH